MLNLPAALTEKIEKVIGEYYAEYSQRDFDCFDDPKFVCATRGSAAWKEAMEEWKQRRLDDDLVPSEGVWWNHSQRRVCDDACDRLPGLPHLRREDLD